MPAAVLAVALLATQVPAPHAPVGEEPPAESLAPVAEALAKLVVLADAAGTHVLVDGERKGMAPVSLPLAPGPHAVSFEATGLPPFHVTVDVPDAGRTEVNVKVAQQRPGPDFARKKGEFDDAMFSVGWKAAGSVCACGLGALALGLAGVFALVPATSVTALPLGSAIGGAVGCVGGTGLCGLGILDIIDTPDEPIIPRVHVIKITPPSGAADATVIEIEAPPVDSDGDPIDDDDDEEEGKAASESGIIEASVRY